MNCMNVRTVSFSSISLYSIKIVSMTLSFSDDLIRQANLTEAELRMELALRLFQTQRLSFGQARRVAGVDVITFQKALAENRIPLHYDVDDFEADLKKSLT